MNVSDSAVSAQPKPGHREWLMLGVLLLLFAIVGYFGGGDSNNAEVFWRGETGVLVESDQPELSSPTFESTGSRDIALSEIGPLNRVVWIRMKIDLTGADIPDHPVAFYLSGPFSADLYWDGQLLGRKGQVGTTKELEVPGPIDANFHIPEGWAGPGRHFVALRVSAFHVGYIPDELFHRITLAGYRSDPRRELRFYAWPLLLSGGFLLTGLFFLLMYQETGASRAKFSAIMAGFVLLQLLAEVSRSLVAYDYQWHLWRLFAIWLAVVGWGLTWQLATWSRTQHRRSFYFVLGTLGILLLVSYFSGGFDLKVTRTITVLAVVPLFVALNRLVRSENDLILMADGALAVALIAAALLISGSLLDRVMYFLLAIHLSATWFFIYAGNQRIDASIDVANSPDFFTVKLAGRQIRINTADVVYLRADGNYCELVCQGGERYLHQHRLGQIMRAPPAGFVRIQRSHAVNTRYLESLQSFEGSRYELRLTTAEKLPVSRYRVAELRELIGDTS